MKKERRGAPRIEKRITVQYGYDIAKDKKRWDMTVAKNISLAGMRISIDRHLPSGEVLCFRIKFPNDPSNWREFKGKIMESKAGGYITRVKFIDLNDEQRESLRNFIEWFKKTK